MIIAQRSNITDSEGTMYFVVYSTSKTKAIRITAILKKYESLKFRYVLSSMGYRLKDSLNRVLFMIDLPKVTSSAYSISSPIEIPRAIIDILTL